MFDWITSGASKAAAKEAYESGEDINVDWFDRLRGVTDESATNAYNRIQQKDLNKTLGAQFAAVGSTGADFGETYQQALGKISRLADARQAGQDNKATAQALQLATLNQKPQMAQIAAQTKQAELARQDSKDQFSLTMQRMLQQDKQNAEARLDDLALRRMEMDREDMRYNENIARMDRKDRQQSIATLVSGLANLGAAFAL